MKTTHTLAAAAAVLLLSLTGCSSAADTTAEADSTVVDVASPTPTPTPTPVPMTMEEAGAYYLETSCVSNVVNDELDAVLTNPDATLEQIQAVGKKGVELTREGAERMAADTVLWPEEVRADAELVFDGYLVNASGYSSIANAQSVEEAVTYVWPSWSEEALTAPQRIRFALDLPSDTSEGCDAFTK